MCCFVSRDIRLNILPDPLLPTAHLDHMHSSVSFWRKKYSIEIARKHLRRVSLVEQELLTLPEHPSSNPVFSWVRVTRSIVVCVMFCRSLFVFLYGFVWPLWCLSIVDLRILITPLESSNSSYHFCNFYIQRMWPYFLLRTTLARTDFA